MKIDLSETITQVGFAKMIGVSESAVSQLISRESLVSGQTAGEWLLDYCSNLREQAAGRASEAGGLDLVSERARLASEQADAAALKNGIIRREYAPVQAMETGLSDVIAAVVDILDTIPGKLKRASARFTADELDIVAKCLADIRNEAALIEIDWFDDGVSASGKDNANMEKQGK